MREDTQCLAERRVRTKQLLEVREWSTEAERHDDVPELFDCARSVASRKVIGATGPDAVRAQIVQAKACLAVNNER